MPAAAANPPGVTDLSDVGTVAGGPESRHVVDALGSLLDGDGAHGRRHLRQGAARTSWAAMLHRLDVAGRALALDAGLSPADAGSWAREAAELGAAAGVDPVPAGIEQVLDAWSRGHGLPVSVDLESREVDGMPDEERAFGACLALAWLVDRSGFPPQVVA